MIKETIPTSQKILLFFFMLWLILMSLGIIYASATGGIL